MKQIIITLFVIGLIGAINSFPAPQSSTPVFGTALSTSTKKPADEAPPVSTETKVEKERPSEVAKKGTTKPPNEEHKNEVIMSNTPKEEQKEPSTISPQSTKVESKEQTTTSSSIHKVEIKEPNSPSGHNMEPQKLTTSTSGNKLEVKEPITSSTSVHKEEQTTPLSLGPKGELTTVLSSPHNQPTTATPKVQNKGKQSPTAGKKSIKSSTTYIDEGKVVIFSGICGPEGCEIEGDVYDEIVPVAQAIKHG